MKKHRILSGLLAFALVLALLPTAALAAPASGTAYASTQAVEVDGKKIEFQMYALKDTNGNDTNYVKLRDVAHVLNGTSAQFFVGWDGAINIIPGQPYIDIGSEMTTPYSGDRSYTVSSAETRINGAVASLDAIELTDDNGGAYTYYKLRDLGTALGFTVDWSAQRGIFIETGGTQSTEDGKEPESKYPCYEERPNVPDLGAIYGIEPTKVSINNLFGSDIVTYYYITTENSRTLFLTGWAQKEIDPKEWAQKNGYSSYESIDDILNNNVARRFYREEAESALKESYTEILKACGFEETVDKNNGGVWRTFYVGHGYSIYIDTLTGFSVSVSKR